MSDVKTSAGGHDQFLKCILIYVIFTGYPYKIDVPSILHKYEIYDPESVIEAKRAFDDSQQSKNDDETDYGKLYRKSILKCW